MSGLAIRDGMINYAAEGRGWPVLFLHGWLGSWRYWWSTLSALGDYRGYALDMWGFGDSDRAERYDVDAYVDLVGEFLNQIGLSRTPVVGHALGAVVAVLLAERRPDRVACVGAVSLPVAGTAINHYLYTGGGSVFARLIGHKHVWSAHPDVVQDVDKADPRAISTSAHSAASLDLRTTLISLQTPVLAVHGAKDTIIAPPAHEWIETTDQARVKFVLFEDSAHFPMLEEPPKFQRLLKDFLDAHRIMEERL